MTERVRKFALTAHLICSLGWVGAVAAFLALGVAGATSRNVQTVHATAIAMQVITAFVIVPLAIASPLSGIVQSLGTGWGLFRHWWVLMKVFITIPSTAILLLVHLRPIDRLGDAAAHLPSTQLARLQVQPTLESGVALMVLLVATVLSTYKPVGRTPFWRI